MSRPDHRQNDHLRTVICETNVIGEANGSARLQNGKTVVISAVYGPSSAKYGRHENFDCATLEVEFCMAGFPSSNADCQSSGIFLKKTLENCICLSDYPRSIILVTVTVLDNDGSAISTALNSVCVSLLTSGIKMKSVPVAVTVVLGEDNCIMLDPTIDEETTYLRKFIVTFECTKNPISGVPPNLLSINGSGGYFNEEQLDLVLSGGVRATSLLHELVRQVTER